MKNEMEKLPVEVIYHIIDNLDAETIFFSIRPVCRLLQSVVQTYNRYKFDFQFISKPNFSVLMHFLPIQHIQSLTLYHTESIPDQITTFFSLIHLRQLTCLQSLNLFGIDKMQFDHLLKHFNCSSLRSFSLEIRHYDDRRRKIMYSNPWKILSQPTLRRVMLKINEVQISSIKWPLECSIEILIVHTDLTFKILLEILSCSPRLHKLVMKDYFYEEVDSTQLSKVPFRQLESLTIEYLNGDLTEFQKFLSFTPSLRYLKFKSTYLFNGHQWKQFIQDNLPYLTQFKFYSSSHYNSITKDDFKSLIDSFQTPFWLEDKKWTVQGQFESSKYIFTIPYFTTNSSVNDLYLTVYYNTTKDDIEKPLASVANITKLAIYLEYKASTNVLQLFENNTFISNLIKIELMTNSSDGPNDELLFMILTCLSKCSRLSKLTIYFSCRGNYTYPYLDKICSLLPTHIKYLNIPISNLQQIETIVERCVQLQILRIVIDGRDVCEAVRNWFAENTIGSIYRIQFNFTLIWIGKKIVRQNLNCKRFKITVDEQE